MRHEEDDEDKKSKDPTWPIIRDLFEQLIIPCKTWENAEIIEDPQGMAKIFMQAYPEQTLTMEDLRLALHDLNVRYERNEHNSKFYYLAGWK